jgi:hypothetical protein
VDKHFHFFRVVFEKLAAPSLVRAKGQTRAGREKENSLFVSLLTAVLSWLREKSQTADFGRQICPLRFAI